MEQNRRTFPPLPDSWSALTWQQLCQMWAVKQHYGGNPDVARIEAFLELIGCTVSCHSVPTTDAVTGETVFFLSEKKKNGGLWSVTTRDLSFMAKQSIPWFDYPYGDPGDKTERDENGNIVKESRDPVFGYVSPMRDALILPEEETVVSYRHYALPQVACNNLTWQQYRSLQAVVQQLFADGIDEHQTLSLQAQFLAHVLTPRSLALLDTDGGSIRFRLHVEYRYNAERANGLARLFEKRLIGEARRYGRETASASYDSGASAAQLSILFHVCFQAYQTAIAYYSRAYPLLFGSSENSSTMHDALQGEAGTINAIKKYAGYAEQQQVYDSNLPFVLDILNTMAKEAKEIEKINSKIKKNK